MPTPENNDVYLGERWRDADARAGFEAVIRQGPAMFLAALALVLAAAAVFCAAAWYLVAPRLAQIAPSLPAAALVAGVSAFAYVTLEYAGLVATVYAGRNFLLPLARWSRSWLKLTPLALKLAPLFRASRDRVVHSFVQVSNAATRANNRRPPAQKRVGPVLVLLPRCIQRPGCVQLVTEDIDNCRRCGQCPVAGLLDLRAEYDGVVMAVLTGGSVVPTMVRRLDPAAVIGVACERELLAGIAAVAGRPVMGIANQRPAGPCRATTLDVDELRGAVDTFARRRSSS